MMRLLASAALLFLGLAVASACSSGANPSDGSEELELTAESTAAEGVNAGAQYAERGEGVAAIAESDAGEAPDAERAAAEAREEQAQANANAQAGDAPTAQSAEESERDDGAVPSARPRADEEDAVVPSGAPADFEGFWAGTGRTSDSESFWMALRLLPVGLLSGERWQIQAGPFGLGFLQDPVECQGRPREGGWVLEECSSLPDEVRFSGFVPGNPDGTLTLQGEIEGPTGVVSFEAALVRIPSLDEPQKTDGVTQLWHYSGEATLGRYTDLAVADGLVFAPHAAGAIEILDADSGERMSVIDTREIAPEGRTFVFDVQARDGILYAATSSKGLLVFDVRKPAAPVMIGQLRAFVSQNHPGNIFSLHNLYLSPVADLVYAINHSTANGNLLLIDVSDPRNPVEIGRWQTGTPSGRDSAHDLNVIEHAGRLIAFVNHLDSGLHVLDVSDPSRIALLGTVRWDRVFSHSGWPYLVDGELYYVHGEEGFDVGLTLIDLRDLTSPRVVARFQTRPRISAHNVQVVGGVAYVSSFGDGLRVWDVRDPTRPREIAHFDTVPAEQERGIIQGLWGVRVVDGVVYVSDIEQGIFAFRVTADSLD